MSEPRKWPILRILAGTPIIRTIAFLIVGFPEGWIRNKVAILCGIFSTPAGTEL